MIKITREQIVHVAKLARLSLDEAAVELYTNQLADILTYIEKLNELDTEGVRPTSHAISVCNAFREDEKSPSIPVERALANAPASENGNFIVPRIV